MKIQVTQWHIDNGEPGNCDRCPVALAMQDESFTHVSVLDLYITYGPTGELEVATPDAVLEFMNRYDDVVSDFPQIKDWSTKMFSPFEFELNVEAAA